MDQREPSPISITFKKELADEPFQGSDLGSGTHKVRMAIASKGKGKSGGARVITFNVIQREDDSIEITLLTIYDKGEPDISYKQCKISA